MDTKKICHKILSSIIILSLLTSCVNSGNNENIALKNISKNKKGNIVFDNLNEKIGDNVPITRGETAKIIALTYGNREELENITPTVEFKDLNESDIYYDYAVYCANSGYMKGDGVYFRGDEKLSLKEASYLINSINPNAKNKLDVSDENANKPISYGLWCEIFLQNLEESSNGKSLEEVYKLNKKSSVILATNKDNKELLNFIVTDNGMLQAENLDLSVFRDVQVDFYEKDGNIVMMENVINVKPTIKNTYVVSYDKNNITIFAGGVYRKYKIVNSKNDNVEIEGSVCDITIDGDTAVNVAVFTDKKEEKVRLIEGNTIKLSNGESYTLDDNFKVYGYKNQSLLFKNKDDIRIGSNMNFIVKSDKVLAGIFNNGTEPQNIRVVLNNSEYNSLLHKSVTVSSENGFFIGDKEYKENEQVVINEENYKDYFTDNYITIKPREGGMITVNSIKRANNYIPKYRGVLEICKVENGFNLISDVTFDEYLYQVVPSEMPSSYGIDASMVQAICARTYAYKQYFSNGYQKYGANVDDSTSSQVYNNIPDNEISREAVDKTTNMIITFNDEPIDAFFFSTTGGSKASAGDVWASNINNFPSYSKEYLKATSEHDEKVVDLSVEDNADSFFRNKNVSAIEKDIDWFRWDFTLNRDELSTSINNNLKDRYKKRPDLIATKQADGTYKNEAIESIGLVKDIQIINRGDGGNVIEIEIIGSEKTIKAYTELNIRSLIKPYQYIDGKNPIVLNMVNSSMNNYTLMPSAFFTIDKKYDSNGILTSATFFGGGNGHAVGLSQNGAKALLESGKNIEEVITHYYDGVEIKKIDEL